jgi:hypothetical protein
MRSDWADDQGKATHEAKRGDAPDLLDELPRTQGQQRILRVAEERPSFSAEAGRGGGGDGDETDVRHDAFLSRQT